MSRGNKALIKLECLEYVKTNVFIMNIIIISKKGKNALICHSLNWHQVIGNKSKSWIKKVGETLF